MNNGTLSMDGQGSTYWLYGLAACEGWISSRAKIRSLRFGDKQYRREEGECNGRSGVGRQMVHHSDLLLSNATDCFLVELLPFQCSHEGFIYARAAYLALRTATLEIGSSVECNFLHDFRYYHARLFQIQPHFHGIKTAPNLI